MSTWDVPRLTWVTGRRAGRVGLRLQFRKEKLYLEAWNRFTGFDLHSACVLLHRGYLYRLIVPMIGKGHVWCSYVGDKYVRCVFNIQ